MTNVYRQNCKVLQFSPWHLKFLECLGSNPIRRFLGVRTIVSRFVKHQMLRWASSHFPIQRTLLQNSTFSLKILFWWKLVQKFTIFKITQNGTFWCSNFAIFHEFLSFKIDNSGNTDWSQISGFQKLVKMGHFWHFIELLSTQSVNVHSSRCWMRLFLWFSNNVYSLSWLFI